MPILRYSSLFRLCSISAGVHFLVSRVRHFDVFWSRGWPAVYCRLDGPRQRNVVGNWLSSRLALLTPPLRFQKERLKLRGRN